MTLTSKSKPNNQWLTGAALCMSNIEFLPITVRECTDLCLLYALNVQIYQIAPH